MHYQNPPYAEKKLVMCLRGEVWDVAVDLRAGSPTFLQWHAEVLSAANEQAMLIPEGFAHGFQTRTDDVEMIYFHSKKYSPSDERGLSPEDPKLSISWPLPIGRSFQINTKESAFEMSALQTGAEGTVFGPGRHAPIQCLSFERGS